MNLEQQLNARWYGRPGILWLLLPLEGLFRAVAALRRRLIEPQRLPVPVIVVGNLAVGGSGKTPMVLALVEHLRQRGYRPGVVSRGYGGKAASYPLFVRADTSPRDAGDEPCLIARRSGVPVAVAPDRPAAAELLIAQAGCDILISDDGLQHYRLARDIEIVLVDAARGFGNGHCLPVGPLREPRSRLQAVSLCVSNGEIAADLPEVSHSMQLSGQVLVNLNDGQRCGVAEWAGSQRIHAVAGIGHPPRFFASLRALGFEPIEHAFGDHHAFQPDDLQFGDDLPVVMTEKDAVKCAAFCPDNSWMLPVDAQLSDDFFATLDIELESLPHKPRS